MEQLLIDSIKSYNEYLAKFPQGCVIIADFIRKDKIKEAIDLILDFDEGIRWLTEMNNLLKKNGYEASLEIIQIHEYLNEINNALLIQDFIVVADMFEYEIAPFFESCQNVEQG